MCLDTKSIAEQEGSGEEFEASIARREALNLVFEFIFGDGENITNLTFHDEEGFFGYKFDFWNPNINEVTGSQGVIYASNAIVNGQYLLFEYWYKTNAGGEEWINHTTGMYAVDLITGEITPQRIYPEDGGMWEYNEAYDQIYDQEYDLRFASDEVQSFAGMWRVVEYMGQADGEPVTEEKKKNIERYKQQYLQAVIKMERDAVNYCDIRDAEYFEQYDMPRPLCGPYEGIGIGIDGYFDTLTIFRDGNGQVVLLVGTRSCFRLEKVE